MAGSEKILLTAFEHGLTVATRNTRHFEELGVTVFDPWNAQVIKQL